MATNHSYRRRLRMFAKDEASAQVCISLLGVVALPDGAETTFQLPDEYVEDGALGERAARDGRSAWDEDTICAVLDCERAPAPPERVLRPPPAEDVAPAHHSLGLHVLRDEPER